MFDIDWKPKAIKQLFKIGDKPTINTVRKAVEELRHFPSCANIKELKQHEYGWRLRVGRYRVLFDAHTTIRIIEIQEVKKRDEHTY